MQSLYMEACGERAKLLEFHEQIRKDDENNEAILKREVMASLFLLLTAMLKLCGHACFSQMLHSGLRSSWVCMQLQCVQCLSACTACGVMLASACAWCHLVVHYTVHPVPLPLIQAAFAHRGSRDDA